MAAASVEEVEVDYEERRRSSDYRADTAAYKKECSTEKEDEVGTDFTNLLLKQECLPISGPVKVRSLRLNENKEKLEKLKTCRSMRLRHHDKYFKQIDKSHTRRLNILANSIKMCDFFIHEYDNSHESTFRNNNIILPPNEEKVIYVKGERWGAGAGSKKRYKNSRCKSLKKRRSRRFYNHE
jgi:hypothetical protein